MKKYTPLLLLLLLIAVFATCKKEPEAPTGGNKIEICKTNADSVAYYTAKVRTAITATGSNEITQHGHCWSTQSKPTTDDAKTTLGKLDAPKSYTSLLTGLEESTIYYVRSYVTYKYGTLYGDEQNIKTLKSGKPVVSTIEVTDVTLYSAKCSGDVLADSGLLVTTKGVCWDTKNSFTITDCLDSTIIGEGTGSFISNITGLNEGLKYFVKAYAINEKGTSYGEVIQFTTVPIALPEVTTNDITEITINTAKSGGNVISDGNGTVTARGVCWNTIGNPTLENSLGHTTDGNGTGSYTSEITGLNYDATYFVKAYATNEKGMAYGQVKSFISINVFTDPRDGQTYETIVIGSQRWFAQNLNYETGNSWCYDNSGSNCDEYGRLYDWETAPTACPAGWHLPSDDEWKTLEMHLGMSQSETDNTGWRGTDEGKKLKSTTGWSSNGNGTDAVSFTALPGGYSSGSGYFDGLGSYGFWWSATESNSTIAWYRSLSYNSGKVGRGYGLKESGFNVRCLGD